MAGKAKIFNNLYYVSLGDFYGDHMGQEGYSGFVICCGSEQEARDTSPDPRTDGYLWWKSEDPDFPSDRWVGVDERDKLTVVFLGQADPDLDPGIICLSYEKP